MSRTPDFLGVGFSLHADPQFLELVRPLIEEDADYFEVAPEALWRPTPAGLEPNDYFFHFAELKRRSKRPFVAHGLAFSLGSNTDSVGEQERFELWLEGLRIGHDEFQFVWFSDHLGWVFSAGLNPVFPLPLPMTEESVARVAQRLRLIQRTVPITAFENGADSFRFGPSGLEAAFWNRIASASNSSIMLDLHNLYTESVNLGFDPYAVLAQLDLSRVLQIHLSGGSESEATWLESRRVFRLDSHDAPIPEEVWQLLEHALPHCVALRGILVERLNGTIEESDVPLLRAEIGRAKTILQKCKPRSERPREDTPKLPSGGGLSQLQDHVVKLIFDSKSFSSLEDGSLPPEARDALSYVEPDGYRMTSLIVRKLRFERLCLVDEGFRNAFDANPQALVENFECFAKSVRPQAVFPQDDALAYHAWCQKP